MPLNKFSADISPKVDAGNSTDVALANGQIFYGPWTKRTTPELIMSAYSDQNFTWYTQFANTELSQTPATPVYTGGSAAGIDSSIPHVYTAGNIEVPVRLQIARDWYRVVIVNDSGSNMTALRFQTSIGKFDSLTQKADAFVQTDSDVILNKSIIAAETDTLGFVNIGATDEKRLKVDAQVTATISDATLIDPQTNAESLIAPNGVLHIAQLVRLTGDNFTDGEPLLDTIWRTTTIGSGLISNVDGEMKLSTGTTADSCVVVDTLRRARFLTGTFNLSHQAISMPNWNAPNVIREFGCFDPYDGPGNTENVKDGISWRNDSGNWYVVRYKNGVEVAVVPEASFNNTSVNPFVKNDNVHVYEFMYNAGIVYCLQDRKLVHTFGSPSSAAYGTPHLRCGHFIKNINGNTTDNIMLSRGSSIGRLGARDVAPNFKFIETSGTFTIKNNPGTLHRIILTDLGTGSATITIYNSTIGSGEIITRLDTNDVIGTLDYGLEFDEGLTIVAQGGNVQFTVVFD